MYDFGQNAVILRHAKFVKYSNLSNNYTLLRVSDLIQKDKGGSFCPMTILQSNG